LIGIWYYTVLGFRFSVGMINLINALSDEFVAFEWELGIKGLVFPFPPLGKRLAVKGEWLKDYSILMQQ